MRSSLTVAAWMNYSHPPRYTHVPNCACGAGIGKLGTRQSALVRERLSCVTAPPREDREPAPMIFWCHGGSTHEGGSFAQPSPDAGPRIPRRAHRPALEGRWSEQTDDR